MGYKITKENFKKALPGTRGNIAIIAQRLNVNRGSVWRFIKRTPEIQEIVDQEAELRYDYAEAELDKALAKGEKWAVELALTKQKRGRMRGYGDAIELNGQIDMTMKESLSKDYEFLKTLSKEAREELLKKL